MNGQPLVPGMIVSNEPGYYEEGNFGIRIENLLIVVKKEELGEYRGRTFLGFERLTHIPIQKKMMDISLLSDGEIKWINDYHSSVREKVLPLVRSQKAKLWLIENTSPI
jgi:Xaa-Pro aminopeptidase